MKLISLGKQKLIFYLSYIKSNKFNFDIFAVEFETMYHKIKQSKKVGKEVRDEVM